MSKILQYTSRRYKASREIALQGYERIAHMAAFNDGSFVTGNDEKDLCYWSGDDYNNRVPMRLIEGRVNSICCLELDSRSGQRHIVVGASDGYLSIYAVGKSLPAHRSYIVESEFGVRGLRASNLDPSREFFSCDGSEVKLWRLTQFKEDPPRATPRSHNEPWERYCVGSRDYATARCCVDSHDGERVVVGTEDAQIHVFERRSERLAKVLLGHAGAINDLAIIGSGDEVLSCADNDPTIRRWNYRTGQLLEVYSEHDGTVHGLSLARGGALVVSCGNDRTLRIWWNGKYSQTIVLPVKDNVWCVKVLANTGDLVCGAADGTLRLFTTDQKKFASREMLTKYDVERINMIRDNTNTENRKRPRPDELLQPGSAHGDTIVINEGHGKINTYRWSANKNKWRYLGEVMQKMEATANDGRIWHEGQLWDHVLSLDIGENKPHAKLAFNRGQDIELVIWCFLREHQLSWNFYRKILRFIWASTYLDKVLKECREELEHVGASRVIACRDFGEYLKMGWSPVTYLPQTHFVGLRAVQLDSIIDKIFKFNLALQPTFFIDNLECYRNTVFIPDRSKKQQLVEQIFMITSRWPIDMVDPILDLARIIVLDKETNEVACSDPGRLLEMFRRFLPSSNTIDTDPACDIPLNRVQVLRLLVNLFSYPSGERFFEKHHETVNSLVRDTEIKGTRHLEIAASTYVLNEVVAATKFDCPSRQNNAFSLFMKVQQSVLEYEAMFRMMVAIGTLVTEVPCREQKEKYVEALRESLDFQEFYFCARCTGNTGKLNRVTKEVGQIVYDLW